MAGLMHSFTSFQSLQTRASRSRRRSSLANGSQLSMAVQRQHLPKWWHLLDCGVPGVPDVGRPVDSLDQLYFQAAALNPILIRKVQAWAHASGGCFCLLPAAHAALTTMKSKGKTVHTLSVGVALADAAGARLAVIGHEIATQLMSPFKTSHPNSSEPVDSGSFLVASKNIEVADTPHLDADEITTVSSRLGGMIDASENFGTVHNFEADAGADRNRLDAEICCFKSTISAQKGDVLVRPGQAPVQAYADNAQVARMEQHTILPPGFARWADVMDQELQGGGLVKWGGLKSVQRALEKSTRSYGKVL